MKTADEFIEKYLSLFAANGCHKASLDHFRDTGRASGSFRDALRAMMDAYAAKKMEDQKTKSCPTCLSDDIQMFTPDLDMCKRCGQQF
jgi:hypothetical protein